jgi:hypothetical protein
MAAFVWAATVSSFVKSAFVMEQIAHFDAEDTTVRPLIPDVDQLHHPIHQGYETEMD